MSHDFISIIIDKKQFRAPKPAMSGAELKALAGLDPALRLFVEAQGKDPDVPVSDSELVHLKPGMHFYSLPVGRVGGETISVHIDKKHFHAPKPKMTGAELKKLAGIDATYRLFKEMPGKEPDVPIADGEVVDLKDGMHFYSLPVGRVGDLLPSVQAEIEEVISTFPDARLHRGPGNDLWLEIPGTVLPAGKGWNQTATDVLVPVPPAYPSAKPPNFFIRPGLARGGGAVGGMGGPQAVGVAPGQWCSMCWSPAAEGRSSLLACVRFAISRFQEAQ
jgi:hypothetical protein